MKKFFFTPLAITDVMLIESKKFEDARGSFTEVYSKKEFTEAGIHEDFVQDHHSISRKGVIRGLHFAKPPYETAKLVRCVKGEILDVAVDIRPDSKTFGKWVAESLSENNGKMLFIPKGFAHGFCARTDIVGVTYKVSDYYRPESESGIIWNDPDIAIPWPVQEPILSDKDRALPHFKDLIK